jgi:hypothetical protein
LAGKSRCNRHGMPRLIIGIHEQTLRCTTVALSVSTGTQLKD